MTVSETTTTTASLTRKPLDEEIDVYGLTHVGKVRKVNQDLNMVLSQPGLKQRFRDLGAFVRPMSPAETAEFIRKEEQVWRPLVRQLGLAAQ